MTALVLVLAAAVVWTLRSGGGGNAPATIFATEAARDAQDDRTLYLLFDRPSAPEEQCSPLPAAVRVVRETATAVLVAADGPSGAGGNSCAAFTVAYLQALPVRLAAPLGDRDVLQDGGHRPLRVLAPLHVPMPGYLPPGFTGAGDVRYNSLAGLKGLPGSTSERAYRRYSHGRLRIDVMAVRPAPDRREDNCLPGSHVGSQLVEVCVSGGRYENLDLLPGGELERVLRNLH